MRRISSKLPLSSGGPSDCCGGGVSGRRESALASEDADVKSVNVVVTDESGQSMAEWAIVSAFLVIALAALFGQFPQVVSSHYGQIVQVICLPLP